MTPRHFSLAEAAEQICAGTMKRPELWVRIRIRNGTFKATKLGRHVRMTQKQIDDAIASLEIGAAPQQPQRRLGVTAASLRRRSA
jgi:hypothetical protein